ncbi:MAG: hypothetical protein DRP78_00275 [Candidatus Omnitrophota bacterium]|nr:MAG: hypothetical protein DRP78_00275 [Candidatus Omnitrophota bacterium]
MILPKLKEKNGNLQGTVYKDLLMYINDPRAPEYNYKRELKGLNASRKQSKHASRLIFRVVGRKIIIVDYDSREKFGRAKSYKKKLIRYTSKKMSD